MDIQGIWLIQNNIFYIEKLMCFFKNNEEFIFKILLVN